MPFNENEVRGGGGGSVNPHYNDILSRKSKIGELSLVPRSMTNFFIRVRKRKQLKKLNQSFNNKQVNLKSHFYKTTLY